MVFDPMYWNGFSRTHNGPKSVCEAGSPHICHISMPQGSVLGLLLFTAYMAPIGHVMSHSASAITVCRQHPALRRRGHSGLSRSDSCHRLFWRRAMLVLENDLLHGDKSESVVISLIAYAASGTFIIVEDRDNHVCCSMASTKATLAIIWNAKWVENGWYGHTPIRSDTSIRVYTTADTDTNTSTPCVGVPATCNIRPGRSLRRSLYAMGGTCRPLATHKLARSVSFMTG